MLIDRKCLDETIFISFPVINYNLFHSASIMPQVSLWVELTYYLIMLTDWEVCLRLKLKGHVFQIYTVSDYISMNLFHFCHVIFFTFIVDLYHFVCIPLSIINHLYLFSVMFSFCKSVIYSITVGSIFYLSQNICIVLLEILNKWIYIVGFRTNTSRTPEKSANWK